MLVHCRPIQAPSCAVAAAATLLLTAFSARAAAPWPAEPQATADNLGVKLTKFEPSGAAWDPASQRLWLVSDRGDLVAVTLDGTIVANFDEVAPELEGVALAADAGAIVYVGREDPPRIYEIDAATGESLQRWTLEEMKHGPDNKRLEGLAFLPDAAAGTLMAADGALYNDGAGSRFGSGGLFLAAHQDSGRIYAYDLDLAGGTGAHLIAELGPWDEGGEVLSDLSGLDYHSSTGRLYLLFDNPFPDDVGRVAALDVGGDFALLEVWTVAAGSDNEEGLALIDDGSTAGLSRIVITEDDLARHEVWLYEGFPLGSGPTTTVTSTTMAAPAPLCGDANEDGGVTSTDALLVLNGAIGLRSCRSCLCDVNDSADLTATDALLVLIESVARTGALTCPRCDT